MSEKSVLIDLSKCIGCRGCQVACKQWNQLPGEKTKNVGSYQNPQDLSATTWTLVRFKETGSNGEAKWTFFKDQCRHCIDPPCKAAADDYAPNSVTIEKSGAVVYSPDTKKFGEEDLEELCPFSIPRKCEKSGSWFKCTFCDDRIVNGLEPACVKACPTGALTFGDRKKILEIGEKRLTAVKKDHPNATLLDADDVRWIYLLHEPEDYFQLGLRELDRFGRYAWRKLLKPRTSVWLASGVLALLFKKRDQRIKINQKKQTEQVS